tara:strand:+ start:1639 stop:2466 length:828 start_codon:yes stop_codon:yes gene_type:complete
MKKLNIGITGSTGVLGKKLILLNKKKYKFIKFTGDITSKKDVFNWMQRKNFDCLFHFAALVPTFKVEKNYKYALRVNYNGTKNIVDAFNHFKQKSIMWFFFSSTSHVYAYSKKKIKENSNLLGSSLYGKTKIKSEKYILNNLRPNINYCIGRIFSFTDTNQPESFFVPKYKKLMFKKNYIKVDNLNQYRDFIHIDDLIKCIFFLMKKNYRGIINIASGKKIRLNKMIQIIAKNYNKKVFFNKNKDFSAKSLIADVTKLKKLGFKNKFDIHKIINL